MNGRSTPWFLGTLLVCVVVVAFELKQPPSEAEARAALVAKHPELAGKPMWFDERIVTEEGFACNLSERTWKYYTWSRDSFSPRYSGEFEKKTPGGWQVEREWWFSQCTRRASDYTPQVPREEPIVSEEIPAPREAKLTP